MLASPCCESKRYCFALGNKIQETGGLLRPARKPMASVALFARRHRWNWRSGRGPTSKVDIVGALGDAGLHHGGAQLVVGSCQGDDHLSSTRPIQILQDCQPAQDQMIGAAGGHHVRTTKPSAIECCTRSRFPDPTDAVVSSRMLCWSQLFVGTFVRRAMARIDALSSMLPIRISVSCKYAHTRTVCAILSQCS